MFAWFGSVLACDSTLRKADWLMALCRTILLPIDSQGGGKTNRKKVKFEIPTHVGSVVFHSLLQNAIGVVDYWCRKKSHKSYNNKTLFQGRCQSNSSFFFYNFDTLTILLINNWVEFLLSGHFEQISLLKFCKSHKALIRKRMKNVISNKPHQKRFKK